MDGIGARGTDLCRHRDLALVVLLVLVLVSLILIVGLIVVVVVIKLSLAVILRALVLRFALRLDLFCVVKGSGLGLHCSHHVGARLVDLSLRLVEAAGQALALHVGLAVKLVVWAVFLHLSDLSEWRQRLRALRRDRGREELEEDLGRSREAVCVAGEEDDALEGLGELGGKLEEGEVERHDRTHDVLTHVVDDREVRRATLAHHVDEPCDKDGATLARGQEAASKLFEEVDEVVWVGQVEEEPPQPLHVGRQRLQQHALVDRQSERRAVLVAAATATAVAAAAAAEGEVDLDVRDRRGSFEKLCEIGLDRHLREELLHLLLGCLLGCLLGRLLGRLLGDTGSFGHREEYFLDGVSREELHEVALDLQHGVRDGELVASCLDNRPVQLGQQQVELGDRRGDQIVEALVHLVALLLLHLHLRQQPLLNLVRRE
mmetsp:Transcript_5394/g.14206  ORF Transcript_5394/g.14206 Transcript_5394/m.14206 type:complete len:432 (-) Transcript_5394:897-2192(-)